MSEIAARIVKAERVRASASRLHGSTNTSHAGAAAFGHRADEGPTTSSYTDPGKLESREGSKMNEEALA